MKLRDKEGIGQTVGLKINCEKTTSSNQLTNSLALGCERTIPTERQPLFGKVSANFCR
jgi:hypothetical protein